MVDLPTPPLPDENTIRLAIVTSNGFILTKKKGKITGEISSIAYSYDEGDSAIEFSSDISRNLALLSCNLKLKTVLLFSANMCGITQEELFMIEGGNIDKGVPAFNLLKLLAIVYDHHKLKEN